MIDRLTLLSQKHGVAAEAERIIAAAVRQKGEQQRKKSACLISGSALEEHAIPAFVQKIGRFTAEAERISVTLIVLGGGINVKKIGRSHQTMCAECKRKSQFMP